MDPKHVSAIIVTKGDVDLKPILETLKDFGEVIVWDNHLRGSRATLDRPNGGLFRVLSHEIDSKVYGRYRGIAHASNPVVYVQDDDCLVDPLAILAHYKDPSKVLCNLKPKHATAPFYQWRIKLVGWGAVFNTEINAPGARFAPYLAQYPYDDFFRIECDRIFTAFSECEVIQLPIKDREFAGDKTRIWTQPDHGQRMYEVERRLRGLIR